MYRKNNLLLDCTLRDGGYVNSWEFGQNTAKKIIQYLQDGNIEIIEIGFLTQKTSPNPDSTKFSSLEQANELISDFSGNTVFVCMINFGEYKIDDIPPYCGRGVRGIRVAFHKENYKEALAYCKQIKEKGYLVFVQAMNTMRYSDFEFLQLVSLANELLPYAFYLVDTFGSMLNAQVLQKTLLLDNNLAPSVFIGFHAHNNLQLAFANAQSILDLSLNHKTIIDCSLFGMGRGAGNLCTELITDYCNHSASEPIYRHNPIWTALDECILPIRAQKFWGYSAPYHIAATRQCHPNYATYLMNKQTLTVSDINKLIQSIPRTASDQYDKILIETLYLDYLDHKVDDSTVLHTLTADLDGKTILILGPGASLLAYADSILDFIQTRQPVVFHLNGVFENFPSDYIFFGNLKRFNALEKTAFAKKKVILTSNINDQTAERMLVNYSDLAVSENGFSDNTLVMLLRLLLKTRVKQVYLAGIDGLSADCSKNYYKPSYAFELTEEEILQKNEDVVRQLNAISEKMTLRFLTPSKYTESHFWRGNKQ